MRLKRGEAMIEFCANLSWLRTQYFENGYIIAKALFLKAQKEKNFKMGYDAFRKHFNKEFKENGFYNNNITVNNTPQNENIKTENKLKKNEIHKEHPDEERVSWEGNKRIWYVGNVRCERRFKDDHITPLGAPTIGAAEPKKLIHDITKKINPKDIL